MVREMQIPGKDEGKGKEKVKMKIRDLLNQIGCTIMLYFQLFQLSCCPFPDQSSQQLSHFVVESLHMVRPVTIIYENTHFTELQKLDNNLIVVRILEHNKKYQIQVSFSLQLQFILNIQGFPCKVSKPEMVSWDQNIAAQICILKR